MRNRSINRPVGGMDVDSEDRLVAPEDYRRALNTTNTINNAERAGTITNIRGNVPVTTYYYPYNNNVTPQGENVAISYVEDTQDNSGVWFIWNSEGKHHIIRHYRDRTSPANPYGVANQVIQYDFGWTRDTRITSVNIVYGNVGDLLYWTDNVKPRSINMTKADVVGKRKAWRLNFPVTCDLQSIIVFTFNDFDGNQVYTVGINLLDPTDREAIITSIAEAINANIDSPVTAEACDCKLYFKEKDAGGVWSIESDCPQLLIPARLEGDGFWYGGTLIERFFDLAKYQFLEPNIMSYGQDDSYEPNYVQNKVFQSRLQPLYDDDSGTELALGVWSQIAINNITCAGTSSLLYNYIDINFNRQEIANEQTLVVLKSIRLVMREHNTGTDRSVIDLDPCDLLDYDYTNDEWVSHYNFYNDIISSAIDPALAAKLYDEVPIKCDSLVTAKNRLITAGIEEGRNAPDCFDASVQMEFVEQPNKPFYKIKGRIRVMSYPLEFFVLKNDTPQDFYSFFPNGPINYGSGVVGSNGFNRHNYPFWNPTGTPRCGASNRPRGGLFHDTGVADSYAFFGGAGWGGDKDSYQNISIRSGITDLFDQRIPEGGWPVYAAGTDYFTVSKQISAGLATDGNNCINTSGGLSGITGFYRENNDLYSTFELLVPDGTYVIRLGSHWCSFGDKLQKGFCYDLTAGSDYQKTSTNVWGIYDDRQSIWDSKKEFTVTVSGADVEIGDFVVMDTAPPSVAVIEDDPSSDTWQPIGCYLYDSTANPLGQANTDMNSTTYTGVSVEKALVYYGVTAESEGPYEEFATTDHNGFWFGIAGKAGQAADLFDLNVYGVNTSPSFTSLASGLSTIFTGTLSQLFEKTLTQLGFGGTANGYGLGIVTGCITTQVPYARQRCSTIITGTVTDDTGAPIEGVSVIFEEGRVAQTNPDGTYNLIVWGDMIVPNLGNFSNTPTVVESDNSRIVDNIVFNLSSFCDATYPNGQVYTPVLISPFGDNGTTAPPPYSPTAKFPIPAFIINEGSNPTVKARKRGGNYTDGIRLYDDAGRFCSVIKAFDVYIPFITEDIGKYNIQDFNGNIYPIGTYKYGKPSLKWNISPTTVFPPWVKYLQWMRTKNSIYEPSYLQWVANQVTYLSAVATSSSPEIQTSFLNSDAVAIKISLSNITSYYAANNDSLVAYTYTAGDRLRLIADRNLVNYTGVNDFKITSYEDSTQSIIIKPEGFTQEILSGTLLEIFNPKSVATENEQIYYEVGEVIKVNNGVPENYSGIFTNGDTYWHGRLITVNDEATKFSSSYPVVIESASISDFYLSQDQDIGRIGIIDPDFKQIYNPSKIRFSNEYSVETANNGLSSFEELNQKDLPREYGSIKRMLFANNNLVCVMESREISNYIGLVTLMQASRGAESGIVSVTDSFLGTEYVHRQMLGTDFAGSVTLSNEGVIYAYNNKSASAWKYTSEETVISDVKMVNYFSRLSVDGISDAISIYDRYREEYLLCVKRIYQTETIISFIQTGDRDIKNVGVIFPEGIDIPDIGSTLTFQYLQDDIWLDISGTVLEITPYAEGGFVVKVYLETEADLQTGHLANLIYALPETIAWNELKKRWTTFYSFTPDCFGVLRTELYSHKEGQIWIHNKNPLYNNFYGVQYKSELTVVPNTEPDVTKNWYAIYLESEQESGFNWSIPIVSNNNNQLSRILVNIFKRKEEFYFAEFKRDLNSSGVTNPIVNGRQLRSSSIELHMENDTTGEFVLRNIVCDYINSARQ